MPWKKNTYALHRWLGLLVSLQLLAWSAGGLVFSIFNIELVRGDLDRAEARAEALPPATAASLAPAYEILSEAMGTAEAAVLRVRRARGTTVLEAFDKKQRFLASVDVESGKILPPVSLEEAAQTALADFAHTAPVSRMETLSGEPPSEFRGGKMPVHRVVLDHPKAPHVYVSPETGDVLARRSALWRFYDFFWMLHIMDYRERENFNHFLLTGMAALALLSAASGLVMWAPRFGRVFPRRKETGT
jgi:uncharacterized iron-regulated membrane protein